jgi:cell pole-organizing protein PopZ
VAKEAKESLRKFSNKVEENYSTKHKAYNSVEELVINIIKPEIKLWLNANLSGIVRQIVEKEVQRLTSKDH